MNNGVWITVIDMVLDTLRTMAMFWLLKMSVAVATESGLKVPGLFDLVMTA